jgi:hypothetical protein
MFFSFARHAYGGLVKTRITILRRSPSSSRKKPVSGNLTNKDGSSNGNINNKNSSSGGKITNKNSPGTGRI